MATTMSIPTPSNKIVNTTLNYHLPPSKGGHTTYRIGVAEYYRYKYEEHAAQIHDMRGREDDFKLDVHGFQHVWHTSREKTFDDEARIKDVVYPETEELLRDITGATRVHIYSHLVRNSSRDAAEHAAHNDPSLANPLTPFHKVVPGRFIHIDFSTAGAHEMFTDNLSPTLAAQLSKTRWSLINVWRPIKPIQRDPLAVCDARTAKDEDLVPITSLLPKKGDSQYGDFSQGEKFEMFIKRFAEGERWWFVDRMQSDEVLLIKCFDSVGDGRATRCPHSAFVEPGTEGAETRVSIEVRALVFFEDQPV